MSLTQNFTTEQLIGQPSKIKINDTSTGSDGSVASRRVYLKKVDSTYLVEEGTETDYEAWALVNTTITLDVLDKDYCLLVKVDWLSGAGAVLYTKSSLVVCKEYGDEFLYELTQQQAANPLLITDADFYKNKLKVVVDLDSAENAANMAVDQHGSQMCLDRATELRLNKQYYF